MNFAKKLALGVLSPLFIILLFATAFDVGFVRTATHPETVKRVVSESGIYDSVIPSVLQQTKSIDTTVGTISASDPAIQKAANAAISPQYIQQNTEMAIDNIYQWLDGKISKPNFSINLSGAKTQFANNIAVVLQERLSGLPACTPSQSKTFAAVGSFDAYNATCLPRGISPSTIADQFKTELVSQQDFLANTSISADNINPPLSCTNDRGPYSCDSGADIPKSSIKYDNKIPLQYQRAKKTPMILSILTVLSGVGIVFLSRTWQKGLRHVGINLVIIGVFMLAFSYALNREVSTKIVPKINIDNAVLQTHIRDLATDLTQQIDKNYWYFGGIYTLLGAGGIAVAEVFRRRAQPPTHALDPGNAHPSEPAEPKKPGKP